MELSKTSKQKLGTCHSELQRLVLEVAKTENCAVICGYRNKAEQNKAFMSGKSKARYGQSKHNRKPSMAVDIVPIPLDWNNIDSFEKLGSKVLEKASELGIKIRWGRDFTGLKDYPHFELIG